ncbi:hypothetical protein PoB_000388600 [Plakobranchus ocellatus]|uniref:Uncharacterized protein n=1 Tax=Plakobranchus ocellatus TaxID=259542 RepID=A0AAV3Y4Q8_9GAST|nr:hypothetical protein PoB_000388600 [Plakobranchus ocellatus]
MQLFNKKSSQKDFTSAPRRTNQAGEQHDLVCSAVKTRPWPMILVRVIDRVWNYKPKQRTKQHLKADQLKKGETKSREEEEEKESGLAAKQQNGGPALICRDSYVSSLKVKGKL